MKIAHVLRRLSFDDWGGTEQVVWNLAKAQLAAGHEVKVFATTALCKTRHEIIDGVEIFRFGAIYPWWPMTSRLIDELDHKGGNPFVPRLGAALREFSPDVIHCHAMARIAELCMRTADALGVPCFVSLHGGSSNVPCHESQSLRAPTRHLVPWGKAIDYLKHWVRRVPEDADGIVCVGEDEYNRYRRVHPNVLFLPNGVDAAAFARARSFKRKQTKGRRKTLLCVARIDRQKNQMMLVEALRRHQDVVLRCVGPVTQLDYLDEIKRRAQELGVADRVTFTGALKPGSIQLYSEFANADVFVLPSRHEPFGIVVLEAWAAGLPVIASDVGGLGRLCASHPDAAMVFSPGDTDAFDVALLKILGDPALAAKMSHAGMAAAADYAWPVLAALLDDFYTDVRNHDAAKRKESAE